MIKHKTIVAENIQKIKEQIHLAEIKYHRAPNSVTLLAVSKQQNIDKISAAINAGQHCFGENYLQEALEKITALNIFKPEWHFIGQVQSNKTQLIAQHFSWVHSIDRFKIAQRLNMQRSENLPPLNVCIELNISQQTNKSGVDLNQLSDLAHAVSELKNLKLRGLMAIPEPNQDFSKQIEIYQQVAQSQINLCSKGLSLDTLSMGMSGDFVAAIAAGSTMVRIGSGIFGERYKN